MGGVRRLGTVALVATGALVGCSMDGERLLEDGRAMVRGVEVARTEVLGDRSVVERRVQGPTECPGGLPLGSSRYLASIRVAVAVEDDLAADLLHRVAQRWERLGFDVGTVVSSPDEPGGRGPHVRATDDRDTGYLAEYLGGDAQRLTLTASTACHPLPDELATGTQRRERLRTSIDPGGEEIVP